MTKKILVVDDDSEIRLIMKKVLKPFVDKGVKLSFAEDGQEGFAMAKQIKPDLIFLDVMMPAIGGFNVCESIKNEPELNKVYIIFVTSLKQEFDKELGSGVKGDEYITKPFDFADIVTRTERVLEIKLE